MRSAAPRPRGAAPGRSRACDSAAIRANVQPRGQDDRDKYRGDAIGESLNRRLRSLCRLRAAARSRQLGVRGPTLVATTTSRPWPLIEAPTTSSPGPTSTGTDSPVSIERSTQDVPSLTTPSTGTFSPGSTTTRSPTTTSSTGTRCSTRLARTWPPSPLVPATSSPRHRPGPGPVPRAPCRPGSG